MGIFSRKNSKPSILNQSTLSVDTHASRGTRTSTTAKSPLFAQGANGSVTPSLAAVSLADEAILKPIDPSVDPAGYLRSIHSVRARTRFISEKAKRNRLVHFNVDMQKFAETAAYVASIVKVSLTAQALRLELS